MSRDLNLVMLQGRLGQDPKAAVVGSNEVWRVEFSVATGYGVKKGDQWENKTQWTNVTLFGKQAEIAAQRLHKGSLVTVRGSLRTDEVEKDGRKVYYTKVLADEVFFNDPRDPNAVTGGGATTAALEEDDLPF